jgi:histidine triad (HIT) family protein
MRTTPTSPVWFTCSGALSRSGAPDGPGYSSVMGESGCLFCRVVAGELPAEVVHRGDRVLAFRDVSPQAPTHVLVVPREHHPDVAALAAADPQAHAELAVAAETVAKAEGHDSFRLVFNTGARSGQSVFHVHGHVLAGRDMTWPPG